LQADTQAASPWVDHHKVRVDFDDSGKINADRTAQPMEADAQHPAVTKAFPIHDLWHFGMNMYAVLRFNNMNGSFGAVQSEVE
jgi:hypothetical protein